LSDTPSAVATHNRPYSSAIAHLTPLAALMLIGLQLTAVLVPRKSLPETVISMVITLGSLVVVLAWLRHGLRPCARCISVRDRTGAGGADTGRFFIHLFHQRRLLVASAVFLLVLGTGLTLLMGLSGHEQYALWPVKVGSILADALMALLAYSALCHIAFRPWCALPHAEQRAADAAE
jgi:hypothetical protein